MKGLKMKDNVSKNVSNENLQDVKEHFADASNG